MVTLIEWICGVIIAIVIITLGFGIYIDINDKKEFIEYCTSRGNSYEDCKWEWKRIEAGQTPTIIFTR